MQHIAWYSAENCSNNKVRGVGLWTPQFLTFAFSALGGGGGNGGCCWGLWVLSQADQMSPLRNNGGVEFRGGNGAERLSASTSAVEALQVLVSY